MPRGHVIDWDAVQALADKGMRISRIAKTLGHGSSNFYRSINNSPHCSSQLRTQLLGNSRRKPSSPPIDMSDVEILADQGMTRVQISERLGCHRDSLCRALRKSGSSTLQRRLDRNDPAYPAWTGSRSY